MDRRISRRPENHLSKTEIYILFITLCLTSCHGELIPFRRDENIWVYLAKNVLNLSDFCLAGGTYIEQTFTSSLVGVCTPLESLRNYTLFKYINKSISYTDIYNWGHTVTLKDREIFSLKVTNVPPAGECVTFVNCAQNCFMVSADTKMNCSTITSVSYASGHVKLPAGWFLICGRTVYSYVPANSFGGPCCLGRLTVFMPQKPHLTRARQELSLAPDCESDSYLFSPAEYISLTVFGMPITVTSLNVEISRLACAMVKSLSATSEAISAISQELGQFKEAVLENRTAIDYLLLRHNHGCEEFKGLCCFNMTDNSQLIEHKVKQVNETVSKINPRQKFFGIDLSWLPSVTGLREAFVVFILFVFFSIIVCCCIQCAPSWGSATKCIRIRLSNAKIHAKRRNDHVI